MKYCLNLFFVVSIVFFSCTKDKSELKKETVAHKLAYCDSMISINKISYTCYVDSVLKLRCVSCHKSGGSAPGDFNSYTVVKGVAAKIADRIQTNPTTGSRMPDGGPYLTDSVIAKIQSWVNDGANDN